MASYFTAKCTVLKTQGDLKTQHTFVGKMTCDEIAKCNFLLDVRDNRLVRQGHSNVAPKIMMKL